MFSWIRYRLSLWKLTATKRRVQRHYAALYKAAVKDKKPQQVISDLIEDQFHEVNDVEENITCAVMEYLYTLAYRYRVPTPEYSDKSLWEESHHTNRRYLNEKAMAEFRAAVRAEQKERWQFWELRMKVFVPALTGLTGAIGALIGLVAIFKK